MLEGRRVGEQLVAHDSRPDAVFAANDLVAVGLLQALVMSGALRVPQDVALIGFDDIDFAVAGIDGNNELDSHKVMVGVSYKF